MMKKTWDPYKSEYDHEGYDSWAYDANGKNREGEYRKPRDDEDAKRRCFDERRDLYAQYEADVEVQKRRFLQAANAVWHSFKHGDKWFKRQWRKAKVCAK